MLWLGKFPEHASNNERQTLTLKFFGSLNTVRIPSAWACMSTSCISPGSNGLTSSFGVGLSCKAALSAALDACKAWPEREVMRDQGIEKSLERLFEDEVLLFFSVTSCDPSVTHAYQITPAGRLDHSFLLRALTPWTHGLQSSPPLQRALR